ncbi:MAG TPA: Smr/MutS family protein [Dehalococcoidia bacterium]|nr:Smr/MutS family protein [Dehalococcoidia bacterium]
MPPSVMGGFSRAIYLLEFDQVRSRLATFTRTVLGREKANVLTPTREILDIATRQQETAEARQFLDQGGALEFGPPDDLRELVQRAKLDGVIRGEELHTLQLITAAARYSRNHLARHQELPLLAGIAGNIPDLSAIGQAISSAISPAGEILDDASPTLRQLRNDSRAAYNQLNDVMQRSLRRFQRRSLVQEPIITQRNGRLVLLIKAEMKSQTPGIVHDVSDSGATVFVEPMPAIELGNRWRETRLAEEREEERILRRLSASVGQAGDDFLLTLDLMARLDLAMAKGRYSIESRATAPIIADARGEVSSLRLSAARHPLLTGRVEPISLEMGEKYRVLLVTGPNAGGKTVALKTVGLLSLMAHAGLHVPAEEARFPLFDGVYADIGDQQSIEQSLSTFSSHIQNLRSIMDQATHRSLVLVDELGTSTDPEEGSALAEAILSHFHEQGVLMMATTHHRGVARYVQEQPEMMNASVDLDPRSLEPTYRVTLGLPGRSYAMTIAARLGIPWKIIQRAQSLMSPTERAAEDLLRDLREERLIVERLRRESEESLAQAKVQQAEVAERLASVEATKVELVEAARQALQDQIRDVTDRLQKAERLLRQVQPASTASPGLADAVREQRAELNETRRHLKVTHWQPIELKRVPWQERLNSGDRVFIRGIPRPVEIITPPNDTDQVEVLLGTMRAKIPLYQLERLAEPVPPSGTGGVGPSKPGFRQISGGGVYFSRPATGRPAETEINLHGFRVDAALEKVEELVSDASLDGALQVRIVHGRGTGALRRAIREYLTGHALVVSLGPDDGPSGDGATVVVLK